jgi:hypothetical protein
MTDKIRIVGEFTDLDSGTVREFASSLDGVQTVSFLKAGVEQIDQAAEAAEAAAPEAEPV